MPPSAGRQRLESLSRFDLEDDPGRGCLLYEAVVSQDTTQLTADGYLDRLEAIQRIKARIAALEAEAVAGFDDALHGVSADLGHRYPSPGDRDATPGERRWVAGDLRSVSDEIALILNVHRGYATTRIQRSCELVHNFPATLAALSDGLLTERAAFTIVSELSVLDDLDDLRAAETAILGWARTHPLTDLKTACRREAAQRSPAATEKAHQRAHDERSVRMYTDDLGRADIVHNQEATEAAAVMTSLSRAAARRRRRRDSRSMDQLRADIALDRLLPRTKTTQPASNQPATTHEPPRDEPDGGEPVHEQPVGEGDGWSSNSPDDEPSPTADAGFVADPAFAPDPDFIDETADETAGGAEATVVIHATGDEVLALINGEMATGGEADHHGPIPQSTLRKYLTKALAQALLPHLPTTASSPRPGAEIHSHGGGGSRIELQITDRPPASDPNGYIPSATLDRYVRLRDRTCQFPGCNRPAEYTDLDHRIAFTSGGRTTAANLWCLCRHHHRLKHVGGWQLHTNPDGTHTWTSLTGRRYPNNTKRPPPAASEPG